MECRLTIGTAIFFLVASTACGAPANRSADGGSLDGDATRLSVHWEGVSLREAISKLRANSKSAIFVDRRVDPTTTVDLSIENASVYKILEKLAATHSLGLTQIDTLVYLGPSRGADALSALVPQRRGDVARLGPQEAQALSQRGAVAWPRLTEPRELVVRLLRDRGWRTTGSDRIPYDLWPEGQLPTMTVADALSVLLVGFDLTYRPLPSQQTIEILPIGENELLAKRPKAATSTPQPRSASIAKNTTQRYTLHVTEQPIGKVINQLSQQLHLDVKVDQAAIEAAGISLEKRISFDVKNADFEGLLDAVLTPAGLKFERDGDQLRILPR